MKSKEIIRLIQVGNYDLSGMSKEEFIQGVRSAFGCSLAVAKSVANKTGNWSK